MRQRWGVWAVVCATAFLLAGPMAWAGEVHVYTDREIRTALAEQTIDVEMYVLTKELRQVH